MSVRPVHWEEGMFLRPHHFQAADRYHQDQDRLHTALTDPHYWGIAAMKTDPEALTGFRLVIMQLLVRFRDGTVLRLPDDGGEIAFDLAPVFRTVSRVTVFLAVPQVRLGQDNLQRNDVQTARFAADTQDVEDENVGGNPQPLSFRRLGFRVLTDQENALGYETMPLCRVRKNDQGLPEIDRGFIPPLLACEAYPIMHEGILRDLHSRILSKLDGLTNYIISRGITMDSHSQDDARRMWQLTRINEASAVLEQDVFVLGVHPFIVYREMCRIVGQLAIFSAERRTPSLPRYNHDDLAGCFGTVKQQILALLDDVPRPGWEQRTFFGLGLRMQVAIEPRWLEAAWQMFLGVRSSLGGEETVKLLIRPERLGMKIGSSDRVDVIFSRGGAGLRFTHSPNPPRDLPRAGNLTYFEISRDNEAEWNFVCQTLTLAIRLRETDIVGNIDGQEKLQFQIAGRTTVDLEFMLYLVPKDPNMLIMSGRTN